MKHHSELLGEISGVRTVKSAQYSTQSPQYNDTAEHYVVMRNEQRISSIIGMGHEAMAQDSCTVVYILDTISIERERTLSRCLMAGRTMQPDRQCYGSVCGRLARSIAVSYSAMPGLI
jgi:hypothetical protein